MLKEGDVVNIFEFTGKVKFGIRGYYVSFSGEDGVFAHSHICHKIAKHFKPNYNNLSDLIVFDKKFKLFSNVRLDIGCIFPEFDSLSDLEYFINILNNNINEPISIF